MSSHHFVKEQQEPAVFILNPSGINFESVAPLLEWSPTILVDQESVDVVLSWGIKIDVVLATSSFQEENMQLLEEQYPLRFLTVSALGVLEEGLHFLLASENQPLEISNSNGQLLFPVQYLTQIEVPEGTSTFSSKGIFWIGERVRA